MLAAALRRHVGDGAFQQLEQRLLHAFAAHIAGDRRVLVLAADLVDFIDVDDAALRLLHIAVGRLQQLEYDVFHILANVSRLGQRGRVDDRKRDVQHFGECLRQQRLTAAGGTDQQNIRLCQFDIVAARAVHLDTLVVVVNGYRELLFRLS